MSLLTRFTQLFKKQKRQNWAGAVVYKTVAGKLEILLWQYYKKDWQLPHIVVKSQDNVMQTLIDEIALVSGNQNSQLEILQPLGNFSFKTPKTTVEIAITLVHAEYLQSDSETPPTTIASDWFTVETVADKVENEAYRQALNLAISKIQRARI